MAIAYAVDDITAEFVERPCHITSTTDGDHHEASLHYSGDAIDIRTSDIQEVRRQQYRNALKDRLGNAWDVILEPDHIHIEYDPTKTGIPAK